MKKDESVYLEGGRRPLLSESSKLLDNVRKRFRKNKQRAEQQASMELDARLVIVNYNFLTNNILQVYNLLFSGTVMLSVTRKEEQYLSPR